MTFSQDTIRLLGMHAEKIYSNIELPSFRFKDTEYILVCQNKVVGKKLPKCFEEKINNSPEGWVKYFRINFSEKIGVLAISTPERAAKPGFDFGGYIGEPPIPLPNHLDWGG